MKALGLNDIREKFLSFFESKDHLRLPSFSLVPNDDPSILLINAGMTPLKPYFTGTQTPPAPRITTCQKCIRTPDIERVGLTSRHGTYFEMLGNFSFGDYFKKDIIPWAWEFCTKVLEISPDLLYPSVYLEDDEAFLIWRDDVGISEDRIARLGKEDNFWEHGTGPCGPCSEIYFDRGPSIGCNKPDCRVGCACDRYVEIWNLVFTQFNKLADGSYEPLDKKNIDTGAGLERIACVMQNVNSLFEVDTIRSILDKVCQKAAISYGKSDKTDSAIRVITDHIRSTTMMISDGVLPSNEGRGYVLRRLLRRAARYGRLLGIKDLFLSALAEEVILQNQTAYPSLIEKKSYILTVIKKEEEAFARTVEQGSQILDTYIKEAKEKKETMLSGDQLFRLHDTFGFPLDLTKEIAADVGLAVDENGFHEAMRRQKDAARQATKAKSDTAWGGKELPKELLNDTTSTSFLGYDRLSVDAKLIYLLKEDDEGLVQIVPEAYSGEDVIAIFDRSVFYAASGGQITDLGKITGEDFFATVVAVDKDDASKFLHSLHIDEGQMTTKKSYRQVVDKKRRRKIAANHTCTHLLQKALRDVLGEHVEQSGSLVTPDRLRFDFTHFQPVTPDELQAIQDQVNRAIQDDLEVNIREMSIDDARKAGAMALFGEKYHDSVRVVTAGSIDEPYSIELCGGTHLTQTSQALQCIILSETGIASGIRRIEAVTGASAYEQVVSDRALLNDICQGLKVTPDQAIRKIDSMQSDVKALNKDIAAMKTQQATGQADKLIDEAEAIGDLKVVIAKVLAPDKDALRALADHIRDRLDHAVVLLSAEQNGAVMFVAMADDKAVKKGVHVGHMIREAATMTGGGGGGRPDMAQAGGKDITRLQDALNAAKKVLEKQIKS